MERLVAIWILILGTIVGMTLTPSMSVNTGTAFGAARAAGDSVDPDDAASSDRAAVTLDGDVLFYVRGLPAYPAEERAKTIRKRIEAVASDRSVGVDSLRVVEMEDRTRIMAGDRLLVGFIDADATAEGVSRNLLAERVVMKITPAIASYRKQRSPRVLLINTLYALGVTAVLALLLFVFRGAFRRLDALAERRFKYQIDRLEAHSHQLVQAQQLIGALHGLLKFLGVVSVLVALYIYLNLVLSLYPWTRPLAKRLFDIFFDPLA